MKIKPPHIPDALGLKKRRKKKISSKIHWKRSLLLVGLGFERVVPMYAYPREIKIKKET